MTIGGSVGAALDEAAQRLRDAGIADARLEARLLLAHAMGVEPGTIAGHPERPIGASERDWFDFALARRAAREPIAYVLGQREFWSLRFCVGRETLDPRPDSETLIESALGLVDDRRTALRVLDLGTGSGCLLLALLSELPNARGVGIDISPEAAAVAQQNARALDLSARACFVVSDWDAAINADFDLIIANPPYIPSGDIASLAPEVVLFEPRGALDGGPTGLTCFGTLAPAIARRLVRHGAAVIEVGYGQVPDVRRIMAAAGLDTTGLHNDLADIPRCLILQHEPALTGC